MFSYKKYLPRKDTDAPDPYRDRPLYWVVKDPEMTGSWVWSGHRRKVTQPSVEKDKALTEMQERRLLKMMENLFLDNEENEKGEGSQRV